MQVGVTSGLTDHKPNTTVTTGLIFVIGPGFDSLKLDDERAAFVGKAADKTLTFPQNWPNILALVANNRVNVTPDP